MTLRGKLTNINFETGEATFEIEEKTETIEPRQSCDTIIKTVNNKLGVDIQQLNKKGKLSRKREIVTARQLAIWLIEKHTSMTLREISDLFKYYEDGKLRSQDHSTMLHAIKAINDLIDTDKVWVKNNESLLNM